MPQRVFFARNRRLLAASLLAGAFVNRSGPSRSPVEHGSAR
jgi:hypothetical protein